MSNIAIVGGRLKYKKLSLREDVFVELLSGVFPKIMKRSYCISKGSDCRLCDINRKCPYSYLFEPMLDGEKALVVSLPDIKIPFAFRWRFEDYVADFSLTLFCNAITHAYEILDVLSEIGRMGLGRERFKFDISQLFSRGLSYEDIVEIENNKKGLEGIKIFDIEEIVRIGQDMPNLSMRIDFLSDFDLDRWGRSINRDQIFFTLYKRIRDRLKAMYVIYLDSDLPIGMKGLKEKSEHIINTVYKKNSLEFKGSLSVFRVQFLIGSYFNIGRMCAFGKGVYRVS